MKVDIMNRIIAVSCALALFALLPFTYELGVTSVAAAAEEAPKRETRRIPAMSEATYKKLTEAQELIDAKDYAGARRVLDEMLQRRDRLNGNEVGQVYNMLGFVAFTEENYGAAIRAYREVLAQGENIPEGLESQTLYTLAQLSFVNEEYQAALDYMERWIRSADNPGADPHIFMGQVYYQMQRYPDAIRQIERGIDIARERGMAPKEQWWALLNFLYFEQENWPKVLEILEILVRDFPKREYWMRLAGILGQEGEERKSLYTYEAADAGGFLTQQGDLTNYAGMLMQAEVPWRAAKVLERGFEKGIIEKTDTTLQSLGQAWQLAQETDKAIPVFLEAARLSDEGRIYERLAQLYLDSDQFDQCIEAANGALRKGGLRQNQTMHIVKGMCQFNKESLTAARESFVACRNESRRDSDESNQRICSQWITYIDREVERRAQLAAADV
jgi:tetratricopeptide (TPR) repeat protein